MSPGLTSRPEPITMSSTARPGATGGGAGESAGTAARFDGGTAGGDSGVMVGGAGAPEDAGATWRLSDVVVAGGGAAAHAEASRNANATGERLTRRSLQLLDHDLVLVRRRRARRRHRDRVDAHRKLARDGRGRAVRARLDAPGAVRIELRDV